MPDVDVRDDLDSVFNETRTIAGGRTATSDGRCVAALTPGRLITTVSAAPIAALQPSELERLQGLLGSTAPLEIVTISYTSLQPMMEDGGMGKVKCIPFLPQLCVFAAAGHSVVVFEGHPSAFEVGVRNCDVLLIDSAMLPFMQEDWMSVAQRAMHPGAKYFICLRDKQVFQPIVPSSRRPGCIYVEPDGEQAMRTAC